MRTKSFIVSTLLLPALMIALMVLPGKLATLKASGTKRLAVVCANPDFARAVQSQLEAGKAKAEDSDSSPRYKVEIVSTPDEATRAALKGRIGAGTLDGYLWLSDDALASRKISYVARETSDFIEAATLQSALKTALLRQELRSRGVAAADADKLMKASGPGHGQHQGRAGEKRRRTAAVHQRHRAGDDALHDAHPLRRRRHALGAGRKDVARHGGGALLGDGRRS